MTGSHFLRLPTYVECLRFCYSAHYALQLCKRVLAAIKVSVRPSVKGVHCDKTKAPSEKKVQLENVAIANALQLEAARRRAVPIRFNFVARAKFEVAQSIRCRLSAFLLLIR